jgi:hypothetical protein
LQLDRISLESPRRITQLLLQLYSTREFVTSAPANNCAGTEAAARAASGYSNAIDFENGNAWSKVLLEMRGLLSPEDVRGILRAIATNGQLFRNYRTAKVVQPCASKASSPLSGR